MLLNKVQVIIHKLFNGIAHRVSALPQQKDIKFKLRKVWKYQRGVIRSLKLKNDRQYNGQKTWAKAMVNKTLHRELKTEQLNEHH